MKFKDKIYTSVWLHPQCDNIVQIIDQTSLPHDFKIIDLKNTDDVANAIQEMQVRGAPLIGATAAWGMYLATCAWKEKQLSLEYFQSVYLQLLATRPTAVNLKWALDEMISTIIRCKNSNEAREIARIKAQNISDLDIETNKKIGAFGFQIIQEMKEQKKIELVHVLTHCNAGWLATVDWGTALSPIYFAHQNNVHIHVWVDETRPRNQGANLTCWELKQEKIPHTLIVDNAGGYLMQNGKVDIVIVGTDRTSIYGDVCNKIGTYLKALAAFANKIPFYVAAPSSSIDFSMKDAFSEITIEQRDSSEVLIMEGKNTETGDRCKIQIAPDSTDAYNVAFDITPAHLITGLITERGVCLPNKEAILKLFPEKKFQGEKSINELNA